MWKPYSIPQISCLLVCLLSLLLPCLSYSEESEKAKVVEAEAVSLGNLTQTVRLIGTVRAKHSADFISKSMGTLYCLKEAGEKVSKGSLIAKLENSDLQKAYQLSLDSSNLARAQYERLLPLAKAQTISQQTLEEKRNAWFEAQKTLSLAKIELDKTRFIAPFDGIVGIYKIPPGSQVQMGDEIVTFYDPKDRMIEIEIPAPLLHQVKDGQTVHINGKRFNIKHVQKMLNPETYMASAYIDYSCDNCVAGETVAVDLSLVEHTNVIVVPASAVFIKNGQNYVYLLENNKTILQSVGLGIKEKDKIEITEGLRPGVDIIIHGHARLFPNQTVTKKTS
jgi:membrane fusion protein, multidrug efflux system